LNRFANLLLAGTTVAVVASGAQAWADSLPKEFLGHWQWTQGSKNDELFVGVNISQKTYYEPGTNCDITRVKRSKNEADSDLPIFLVDMLCSGDGANLGRPQRVHEVWSLRYVNNEPLLIRAGPTSINLLQRVPGE
jgi:hypothetical protein